MGWGKLCPAASPFPSLLKAFAGSPFWEMLYFHFLSLDHGGNNWISRFSLSKAGFSCYCCTGQKRKREEIDATIFKTYVFFF